MEKIIIVWHVTPTENIPSILKRGLFPNQPEPDGDMAISFFTTKENAIIESQKWIIQKWKGKPLTILTVNIKGINVTQTFQFEVITTNTSPVAPDRILHFESLTF